MTVERLISSLTATRAELIDGTREWVETSERIGRRRGFHADGTADRHAWSDAKVAQRVFVSELAAALRISERDATRLAAESESLVNDIPSALEVLREGRISYRHAAVLVDQAWSLPSEARGLFADAVLPHAERLAVNSFARIATALRSPEEPRTFAQLRADAFAELLLDGEVVARSSIRTLRGSAASCDVDHTTDSQYDGTTGIDNLAHLCRRHHQLKPRPGGR